MLNTFGKTNFFRFPLKSMYHNNMGYCYEAKDGGFVVFGTGPIGGWKQITGISISIDRPHSSCVLSIIEVSKCLGNYCLGVSLQEFENILGKELEKSEKVSEYYSYTSHSERKISEADRIAYGLSDDINYWIDTKRVWVKIEASKVVQIGFERYESL